MRGSAAASRKPIRSLLHKNLSPELPQNDLRGHEPGDHRSEVGKKRRSILEQLAQGGQVRSLTETVVSLVKVVIRTYAKTGSATLRT